VLQLPATAVNFAGEVADVVTDDVGVKVPDVFVQPVPPKVSQDAPAAGAMLVMATEPVASLSEIEILLTAVTALIELPDWQ
jgi:hypothetical protein